MKDKNNYLFVDDGNEIGRTIPDEILMSVPPIKENVIAGTLGRFNIKDCKFISED